MPALAPDAAVEDRVGTRNRVARLILANGPSTAADLAARLALTPAGVRRHLDVLLAEGLVEAREQRVYGQRGRGRPAKVFALTGAGRAVFHHTYDDMAIDALRFIAESGGEKAIDAFAHRRFAGLAERYRLLLAGAAAAERPRLLAEALTADGYAASTRATAAEQAPGKHPVEGAQVCQHHCPVQHVAEEFPQLCEAETQVFAELLGTHVQRLATIAHGDGVCTTFIPAAPAAAGQPEHPAPARASSPRVSRHEQSEGASA
ncbi:MarR family transcriptional regulator [Actinocrinis puniceicyclus]|uniref:MarR family transcriptional regulator n=1 Tax=Actinocrinis puniceicyclus TaxID=977794 RepID=A0A8J7WG76_9ACTN|nr:MarR family transcriptional regulator [Actinocrinis puniceicyclus]